MTKQNDLEWAAALNDEACALTKGALCIMNRARLCAPNPELIDAAKQISDAAARLQQETYNVWYRAREALGE